MRGRIAGGWLLALALAAGAQGAEIVVRLAEGTTDGPLDGRLLVLLATDESREPREQFGWGLGSAQGFGVDVEGWAGGEVRRVGVETFGYPVASLDELPAGEYFAQAVLHRYATFQRAVGPPVSLPASWAAGQQWNREPGNLFSTPRRIEWPPAGEGVEGAVELVLDQVIPPVEEPADTKYVRHLTIRSELLSEFWGREMELGAHVLVPEGFDEHPEARYPLMLFHGHFPADFGGFRTEPPDPDLACEHSERFDVDCYNRIQQEEAYAFYQRWIAPDFPRFLVVEVQHANPFYDDSYAVNSANLGPYGDAIHHELIPAIEERFRGLGEGWARFTYGGSTGGWEALASQVFYPEMFNGAFVACPDPIDFRDYVTVDIYEDDNAYVRQGPFLRLPRAGRRDALGHLDMTMESFNHLELVLGTRGRSGQQFDIWEAVYSPMGEDGYPRRLWDKETGVTDPEVAAAWRRYDLRHVLESEWPTLGPQVAGKLHIYCGDMDNYYLNNAVYRMEAFLESTSDPHYGGVVDYGDRAEHCWNGDHDNPNHLSRLRYNTMYLPLILQRIETTAPAGADLTSWRHRGQGM